MAAVADDIENLQSPPTTAEPRRPAPVRHRSLKVSVGMSWLAHFVMLCIGLFLMPYVKNTVGDATYGTWLLVNSMASYAGLLYLGLGQTITKYTAEHHARHEFRQLNEVTSCILSVYLGMGGVACGIGLGAAYFAEGFVSTEGAPVGEIQLAFVVLGINAAIALAGSVFGGVLLGLQRFDVDRLIHVAMSILRLVLTVVFLSQRTPVLTLALVFLAVTVIENLLLVVSAFVSLPELRVGPRYLTRAAYERCFHFGGFAFLSAIADYLIYFSDLVVVGLILGPVAVVPYGIASRLCQMVREPILQIGEVFLPKAGQLHAQSRMDRLRPLVYQGIGVSVLLTSTVFIGAAIFSPLLIEVWMGAGYDSSYGVLLILLAGQMVALPLALVRRVLFGIGQVRVPALLFLAEAIANLVLSLLLIRPLGLYGVALGTAIPIVAVELCLLWPYAARTLGLSLMQGLGRQLGAQIPGLCVLVVFCLGARTFNPTASWVWVGMLSAGGAVCLVANWWLARAVQRWVDSRLPLSHEGA